MNDPQDTTYGSDADLLEERERTWKARAEKAEAELTETRAERDEYRKAYLRAESDLLAEREALRLARRGVDDMKEAGRAAVLREREECLNALLALERRRNPGELVTLQDGIAAIRARSK